VKPLKTKKPKNQKCAHHHLQPIPTRKTRFPKKKPKKKIKKDKESQLTNSKEKRKKKLL